VIPRTVLIAVEPFGAELNAQRAALAIGRGLQVGDPSLGIDPCPIEAAARGDAPAARGNVPAARGDAPAERGNVPAARGDARAGQGDIPAAQGNVPVAPGSIRELLEALDFDARMRTARAVVVGGARLDERTLLATGMRAAGECLTASAGNPTFEIATRARQGGVPAYAVVGENALSLFDARILDLQVILRARNLRGLRRAGERLAGVM
jgi:hypothetical protein